MLAMIDDNGGILNEDIVYYAVKNNLLGAIFLRNEEFRQAALKMAWEAGYTLNDCDMSCILLTDFYDAAYPCLEKMDLSDDVLVELFLRDENILNVLKRKGVFERITKEKFAYIFANGYNFGSNCELVKILQSKGEEYIWETLSTAPELLETLMNSGLNLPDNMIMILSDGLEY